MARNRKRSPRRSNLESMATQGAHYVLTETTRAYIERFTADLVERDMRDPVVRTRILKMVARAYAEAKRQL